MTTTPRVAGRRRRTAVPTTPAITSRSWKQPSEHQLQGMRSDVVLDLGWGRLVFGQTFADLRGIVDALRAEETGERDICIYPRDPHVLVGLAPDELFIDPSYTYRLDLHRYRPRPELIRGVFVRTVTSQAEMDAINEIYALNGMVVGDADVMWAQPPHPRLHLPRRRGPAHRDRSSAPSPGSTTSSPSATRGRHQPVVPRRPRAGRPARHRRGAGARAGRALRRPRPGLPGPVGHARQRGAPSALYRKLGFTRVAAVCVKRKNPINTPLFAARPPGLEDLNPYARIIAEEALRRGIRVEVTDAE